MLSIRGVTVVACAMVMSVILAGCGKMATEYDGLVKEYKKVLCTDNRSASAEDRSKLKERVAQLNTQYELALATLSETEKAKLTLKWSMAQAEASQGNCN